MKFIVKTVFIKILISCWVVSVSYADTPSERVRSMMDGIIEIQTEPEMQLEENRERRLNAIKDVISRSIDFNAKAMIALGDFWNELNSDQKKEFIEVFKYLFQDSYSRLVLNFIGREEVEYRQEEIEDNGAMVYTAIIKANDEIKVDYAVIKNNGTWIVKDITVDGVSIAGNYNRSFMRVIRAQSFDALLERMTLQKRAIEQ